MIDLGLHFCRVLVFGLLASFLVFPAQAGGADLMSPRLKAVAAAVAAGDEKVTEEFWREVAKTGTPMIEALPDAPADMLVTFLWQAKPKQDQANVGVSPNGLVKWDRLSAPLQRLGKTNIWYRSYQTPRKARFTYNLTWPQGETPRADALYSEPDKDGLVFDLVKDPLARLTYATDGDKGRQFASYAEGPDAIPEPFVVERKDVPRGKIETIEVESKILSNRRKVSIYTPPGYAAKGKDYGLLLVFDREAYLTEVPTPTILDNMLAEKVIPPMVAVLVNSSVEGNKDEDVRSRELPPSPAFQRFLREELIPLVRARYAVSRDPKRNVVAGSSYGGIASAFTAFTSPDIFGNVVSQSGSYWWDPKCCYPRPENMEFLSADAAWLVKQYAVAPKKPIKFYLDVGLWESADQLLPNRIMRSVLEGKGYGVTYREFTSGHDYLAWRGTLSDGLMAVVGTEKAKAYLDRHLN